MQSTTEPCPLCASRNSKHYFEDKRRTYLQCQNCQLVFVPKTFYLSAELEKKEYDKHRNDSADEGYRQFLSRIANPLIELLPSKSHGLDFGCGPGPTLSKMLEERGHTVDLYDHYYFNIDSVWKRNYDFITATEVVEHLYQPGAELKRLWQHLVSGGYLALMTKLVIDKDAFANWHYKNDPTHVCFYSFETFAWLSGQLQAQFSQVAKDAFIFTKPNTR